VTVDDDETSPVYYLQRIQELECENAQLRDRIVQYVWETT
jgi:hypothetical protein